MTVAIDVSAAIGRFGWPAAIREPRDRLEDKASDWRTVPTDECPSAFNFHVGNFLGEGPTVVVFCFDHHAAARIDVSTPPRLEPNRCKSLRKPHRKLVLEGDDGFAVSIDESVSAPVARHEEPFFRGHLS